MTEEEDQFGGLPVRRWRDLDVLKDGEAVLARNASRQIFGFREDGKWFEMIDGEEYQIDGFEPIEWAVAHGGGEKWG